MRIILFGLIVGFGNLSAVFAWDDSIFYCTSYDQKTGKYETSVACTMGGSIAVFCHDVRSCVTQVRLVSENGKAELWFLDLNRANEDLGSAVGENVVSLKLPNEKVDVTCVRKL